MSEITRSLYLDRGEQGMKFLRFIYANFLEILAVLAFVVLSFLTFFQVCSRYIFQTPITFSEEIARFLFIWISFLGAAIVMKSDKHIRLDLFHGKICPRLQHLLDISVFLLIFCFSVLVLVQGVKLSFATTRQIAPVSRIPMAYIYLIVPISALFMGFYAMRHIISRLQQLLNK